MKIFLTLLCWLALVVPCNGGMMLIAGRPPSGVVSYPYIDFYWGCESTTAEKSRGDTVATVASGAAINADVSPPVGTYGCDYPTNYDYHTFDIVNNDILSLDQVRIGRYVYVTTWPVANSTFIDIRKDSNNYLWVQLVGSGDEVYVKYYVSPSAIEVTTTDANMVTGGWYFIEVIIDNTAASTDTVTVKVDGVQRGANTGTIAQLGVFSGTLIWGQYLTGADFAQDQGIISSDITKDLYEIRNNTSFSD